MKIISITIITLILFLSWTEAIAWGGRGHDAICQAAAFLVKNPELKKYLARKPHVMGHLCNIPDTSWRSLAPELNKVGAPTHYIDADILPVPIKDIPLDLKKIVADYTGKKRANRSEEIKSVPNDLGTLWWRVDQLQKLAGNLQKNFKESEELGFKSNPFEDKNPYNENIYKFIVYIGIIGHFIGDSSQPFHSTDDYDGFAKGHGGIHTYYEDVAVGELGPDLMPRVVKEANKLLNSSRQPAFLTAKSTLEKMKEMTIVSFSDIEKILKADLLKKNSIVNTDNGLRITTPAEREPIEKTIKKFEPLILTHMGRAAALLATIWDESYLLAGSPKLSFSKSYKYPLNPEFIPPDYF